MQHYHVPPPTPAEPVTSQQQTDPEEDSFLIIGRNAEIQRPRVLHLQCMEEQRAHLQVKHRNRRTTREEDDGAAPAWMKLFVDKDFRARVLTEVARQSYECHIFTVTGEHGMMTRDMSFFGSQPPHNQMPREQKVYSICKIASSMIPQRTQEQTSKEVIDAEAFLNCRADWMQLVLYRWMRCVEHTPVTKECYEEIMGALYGALLLGKVSEMVSDDCSRIPHYLARQDWFEDAKAEETVLPMAAWRNALLKFVLGWGLLGTMEEAVSLMYICVHLVEAGTGKPHSVLKPSLMAPMMQQKGLMRGSPFMSRGATPMMSSFGAEDGVGERSPPRAKVAPVRRRRSPRRSPTPPTSASMASRLQRTIENSRMMYGLYKQSRNRCDIVRDRKERMERGALEKVILRGDERPKKQWWIDKSNNVGIRPFRILTPELRHHTGVERSMDQAELMPKLKALFASHRKVSRTGGEEKWSWGEGCPPMRKMAPSNHHAATLRETSYPDF